MGQTALCQAQVKTRRGSGADSTAPGSRVRPETRRNETAASSHLPGFQGLAPQHTPEERRGRPPPARRDGAHPPHLWTVLSDQREVNPHLPTCALREAPNGLPERAGKSNAQDAARGRPPSRRTRGAKPFWLMEANFQTAGLSGQGRVVHACERARSPDGLGLRRKNRLTIAQPPSEDFRILAHKGNAALEQIQLSLGHASVVTTERYLGVRQNLHDAPCDYLGLDVETK